MLCLLLLDTKKNLCFFRLRCCYCFVSSHIFSICRLCISLSIAAAAAAGCCCSALNFLYTNTCCEYTDCCFFLPSSVRRAQWHAHKHTHTPHSFCILFSLSLSFGLNCCSSRHLFHLSFFVRFVGCTIFEKIIARCTVFS